MSEQITLSIAITQELKELVQKWAEKDDRSVSYIIRQLVAKEAKCRAKQEKKSGFQDL